MRSRAVQEFSPNFQSHEQQDNKTSRINIASLVTETAAYGTQLPTWVRACLMFACGIQRTTINFNFQTLLTFSVLGTLSSIIVRPDSQKKRLMRVRVCARFHEYNFR